MLILVSIILSALIRLTKENKKRSKENSVFTLNLDECNDIEFVKCLSVY